MAQAYLAYSGSVAGEAAGLLGHDTESERLRELSARSRAVFRERYLDDEGRLRPSTQTAYAVALRFGLLEPAEHPAAAARLADIVKADAA